MFNISNDFVWRQEEEGGLLYNVNTGELCLLNDLAVMVLHLCEQQYEKTAIVSNIKSVFKDIPGETIDEDVNAFLENMIVTGVLIPAD